MPTGGTYDAMLLRVKQFVVARPGQELRGSNMLVALTNQKFAPTRLVVVSTAMTGIPIVLFMYWVN